MRRSSNLLSYLLAKNSSWVCNTCMHSNDGCMHYSKSIQRGGGGGGGGGRNHCVLNFSLKYYWSCDDNDNF